MGLGTIGQLATKIAGEYGRDKTLLELLPEELRSTEITDDKLCELALDIDKVRKSLQVELMQMVPDKKQLEALGKNEATHINPRVNKLVKEVGFLHQLAQTVLH